MLATQNTLSTTIHTDKAFACDLAVVRSRCRSVEKSASKVAIYGPLAEARNCERLSQHQYGRAQSARCSIWSHYELARWYSSYAHEILDAHRWSSWILPPSGKRLVLTAWMVMRSIERRILKPVGRGFYHGTRGDYPGTTDEVVRRLPVTAAQPPVYAHDKHLLADGRPGLTGKAL